MPSKKYPIVKSEKSLRDMVSGEQFLVQVTKNGVSQVALCSFDSVEKGMVVGKVVTHFVPRGHVAMESLAEGNTIRKRATSCFLWYQGENDRWPRCHWFTSLDAPAS